MDDRDDPGRPDRRALLRRAAVAVAVLAAGVPVSAAPARRTVPRHALVIGNAAYRAVPLRNPVRDARLIATTLRRLDFEVEVVEDATLGRMVDAARQWLASSREADSRFFYFAGHAVQWQGRNFVLPVDALIRSEDEIPSRSLNVTELTETLARTPAGVNLVVLDACRNQPFPVERLNGTRAAPRAPGLRAPPSAQGTLIAFSTAPGALAADGRDGEHSVYTRHLASQMLQPGLTVEALFKRVRAAVARDTGNRQVPWEASSLVGD